MPHPLRRVTSTGACTQFKTSLEQSCTFQQKTTIFIKNCEKGHCVVDVEGQIINVVHLESDKLHLSTCSSQCSLVAHHSFDQAAHIQNAVGSALASLLGLMQQRAETPHLPLHQRSVEHLQRAALVKMRLPALLPTTQALMYLYCTTCNIRCTLCVQAQIIIFRLATPLSPGLATKSQCFSTSMSEDKSAVSIMEQEMSRSLGCAMDTSVQRSPRATLVTFPCIAVTGKMSGEVESPRPLPRAKFRQRSDNTDIF